MLVSKSELSREIKRKAFHLLSLAYLAAYFFLGYPRVIGWLMIWTLLLMFLEAFRLYFPKLNEFLIQLFKGLSRPEEKTRYSGAFYTAAGALIVIFLFGKNSKIVSASLFCAALGDASAALIGKIFGTHKIFGGRKSLEGSLACFFSCLLICLFLGFPLTASIAASMAGAALEFLPTTAYFNDNLWLPLGSALILSLWGR